MTEEEQCSVAQSQPSGRASAVAEVSAGLGAVESAATSFCWLMEAPGQHYLGTLTLGGQVAFRWTRDPNKALRFWSEEQADQIAAAIRALNPDLWSFAGQLGEAWPREHGFLAPSAQDTSDGKEIPGEPHESQPND